MELWEWKGMAPIAERPISIGLILASKDPLHVDQIVCDLLGISRKSLLTNRVALEQGMGKDEIEVLGERVEEIQIHPFQFLNSLNPIGTCQGFWVGA